MFKRLAYFTDIHHGRSMNSPIALKDNDDFVDWFIAEAKRRQCETFVFGGDWYDNRLTLQVNSLDHAHRNVRKLALAFDRSYYLVGNHDCYFKTKRSVTPLDIASDIPKVTVIGEPTQIGGVTFLPWLVEDEKDHLPPPTKYTFAHLEMSGFMMNAASIMPETDHTLGLEVLSDHGTVFTGHYHKRQSQRNVIYTGNVMPFDFSDNWDDARGAMFLEWDGRPEFVSWPDQPLYRTMALSDVLELDDASTMLGPKMTVRMTLDSDLSYQQAQTLRDHYMTTYGLRKLDLIPTAKQEEVGLSREVVFQSIDQIVTDGLLSVQSQGMKSEKLVSLYRSLS